MQTPETAQQRAQSYRDRGWWDNRTLHGVFAQAAERAPQRIALVDPSDTEHLLERAPVRCSYTAVAAHAEALAAQLAEAGLRRGDAVLAQLPNTAELVILYLALSRAGMVLSPVPMQYGRHELAYCAATLSPKAYIGVAQFKGAPIAAAAEAALPAEVLRFTLAGEAPGFTALNPFARTVDMPPAAVGEAEDRFTVCWTSGTTGTPKGVPRTHQHWFSQTLCVAEAVPLPEGAVMLNPFPLTNMAALSGFLFYWPQIAGTLVLHHPFDLPLYLRQLSGQHVAYTIAPPAVLNMFLKNEALHEQVDLSALRYIASGSAPLDPWMVAGFREKFGVEIINFFGSNEGIGLVGGPQDVPDPEQRATLFPRYGVAQFSWSNRFAERFESRLVDWQNDDAPITQSGQTGELLIRGPNVFEGYLGNDRSQVFDDEGFFRTGDLFEIAGEGELARFYRFKGRCKDLIIRGGMNISPEELDIILSAHPAVLEAAVCGYPDAVMGEKVCLFAVVKPGESLDLVSVCNFLEAQGVAKFKWPERLELIEQLPRNPLNKVVRVALREQL